MYEEVYPGCRVHTKGPRRGVRKGEDGPRKEAVGDLSDVLLPSMLWERTCLPPYTEEFTVKKRWDALYSFYYLGIT